MNHNNSPPQQKKTNISICVFLVYGELENLFRRYIIRFQCSYLNKFFYINDCYMFNRKNCRRYAVIFGNKACVRVQKFEDIPDYEKNILRVKPLRTILWKSEILEMTKISRAYDEKIFKGNTIVIKVSEENDKHRWVYIGGNKVCSFPTNDDISKYISNMGKNLTSYSFAIGSEYVYSLTAHFKFFKIEMVKNDEYKRKKY